VAGLPFEFGAAGPVSAKGVETTNRRTILALLAAAGFVSFAMPASAQFGKNKVQYERFEFEVLETEHFRIHFYPQAEPSILDAARMAERAYARLAKVFRHEWDEKKPLILYASQSDFQQTNVFRFHISEGTAGITEGLRDRIVLFFPSAYPEFEHTLTHEIVHAFQFDIMRRGALAQGTSPLSFRPPLWFVEGMAEYLSTGEIDPHTAMWLRDASLAGYLTSLDELSRVGDVRVYRFGQAIWYYIGTRYGDEKIGEIMHKAPLVGVEGALRSTLDVSLDELSEEWLAAVRLTYMPRIVEHDEAERVAVRLTHHVREGATINVAPALSPDGRRLAFISDRDHFNDLYVMDADTGEGFDKLVKGGRTETFESLRFLRAGMAFSPDGEHLAFSSRAGEQDALYVMRVADEEIVAAHRFGLEGIETPSWSPDGRRLVFTGLVGGTSELFVVDRDGGNLRRLTNDRYAQRDPVWSPDGRRIAFTTDFGRGADFDLLAYGGYRIGLFDLETGEVSYLPDGEGNDINPQWGPHGSTLAFLSDRTGITNVFLHDLETKTSYQLTDLLAGVSGVVASSPALTWSRNGRRMVFSAFGDGGWDLYRIDEPLELVGEPSRPREKRGYDLDARALVHDRRLDRRSRGMDEASPSSTGAPEESTADVAGERGDDAVSYYLRRERSRREVAPRPVDVPSFREPVDVATLLSDPTIGLPRDTTRFERRDYEVRFEPDLVTQPRLGFVTGLGAFGASQLAFSDLLGDHNLFVSASVFGSLTDSNLFFTYVNLKERLNWGVTTFQFRSDFAPQTSGFDDGSFLFRSDVQRGVQVLGSYPINRFRRVEFGAAATHVDRRVARFSAFDPTPDIEENLSDQFYVSPSGAYVHDTAFFGSTGPVGGSRQRFEVQKAVGSQSFAQLYADVRQYWLFARRLTFAVRGVFLGLYGQDEENLRFQSVGGPTLLRGYDYRGDDGVVGTEMGLVNLELRFPLVDQPRLGGSTLPPIRGAVWFDIGYARCPQCGERGRFDGSFRFSTADPDAPFGFRLVDGKASFGGGIRSNLLGFAVFRLDYARRTDLASLGAGRVIFTLAPEF